MHRFFRSSSSHSSKVIMIRQTISAVGRSLSSTWGKRMFQTSGIKLNDEEEMRTQRIERLEKTVNQVMFLGRVGGNPEMRGTEQHPVVIFSLATHNNYRKGEDLIQQTDWHRIAVFKPHLRETVHRYLTKGQRVMVQGRIGYLERRDPDNNSLLMKTATIVADEVIFFNKNEISGE
ncbi:single-stranded DNA-binding protein, mitochondrial isoform X2 [Procambarus clarkii]|uniref:single-stranded DNA-binding protein, mitochondrial isoform X2 n=1 Tax=Procambarus clarkii TaxID=6728 RepID=UPI003742A18F